MLQFVKLLSGGDLRSVGKSNSIVSKVKNQNDFDELFKCLFQKDRIVVMRAADTVEKLTVSNPLYLIKHKKKIMELSNIAKDKEFQWHLSLLIPRLNYTGKYLNNVWNLLSKCFRDLFVKSSFLL